MIKKIFLARQKRRLQQLKRPATNVGEQRLLHHPRETWRRRLSLFARRDGWALLGIVLVVTGMLSYIAFAQKKYTINEWSVSKLQFINSNEVHAAVESYVRDPILGFIPRNNFWTLHQQRLEEHLQNALRNRVALASVTVVKKYPQMLHIEIRERIPAIAWITTSGQSKHYYLVDPNGDVTQEVGDAKDLHPSLPVLEDENRETLGIQWHIISPAYITFLLALHDQFSTQTGIAVSSYALPKVDCRRATVVAEKIFSEEIERSASEEFRQKKRKIQEQFQQGLLTVDESLDLLEEIKKEELQKLHPEEGSAQRNIASTKWETVYVPTECDLVTVARDVTIQTNGTGDYGGGFRVLMDSTQDLNTQMQQLMTVLQQHPDRKSLKYIDVRLPDRVYFQ